MPFYIPDERTVLTMVRPNTRHLKSNCQFCGTPTVYLQRSVSRTTPNGAPVEYPCCPKCLCNLFDEMIDKHIRGFDGDLRRAFPPGFDAHIYTQGVMRDMHILIPMNAEMKDGKIPTVSVVSDVITNEIDCHLHFIGSGEEMKEAIDGVIVATLLEPEETKA